MEKLRIGLVQQSCSNDREANIEKSMAAIRRCAAKGAQRRMAAMLFSMLASRSFEHDC